MEKYILSIDQGTSSCRAIIFDKQGNIAGIEQVEFKQYYPQPGWVEQDAVEIWESQLSVTQKVLVNSNIKPPQICAIGITNQRETTVIWDRNTGKPVYNAIVWQDKRTSERCSQLITDGYSEYICDITGLKIDSYFSATKAEWIIKQINRYNKVLNLDDLMFGTIDTWLIYNLTGFKQHVTDYTNASRTMLFNINSLQWDKKLLECFGLPLGMMPKVVGSSQIVGYTEPNLFGGCSIPIAGVAGDQQSALFGQGGFDTGLAKNTYGTGCFILMNTGTRKVKSENGLITTLTCDTTGTKPVYALEGSVFIAGAAIKWLRDSLKLIGSASESGQIASQINGFSDVYVVPAFAGLGAPYWNQYARGAVFGVSLGTTDKHIVKATLESLAYQSKDVITAMQADSGLSISSLFVDGGACANNYLMQFQANLLDANVYRPKNIETTALGAAFLAGLATGFWKNKVELMNIRKIESVFNSNFDSNTRDKLYAGWRNAVNATLEYSKNQVR